MPKLHRRSNRFSVALNKCLCKMLQSIYQLVDIQGSMVKPETDAQAVAAVIDDDAISVQAFKQVTGLGMFKCQEISRGHLIRPQEQR